MSESKFDQMLDTLIEIRDLLKTDIKIMRDMIRRKL